MSSICNRLYNSIKLGQKGRNKGLSSGFDKLDKVTFGIQRKYFTTICGDSGSGKSTLALYMYVYRPLMEFIKNGKDVNILYFSFEMSDEVLFAKLLSMYIWEEHGKEISYQAILSLTETISDEDLEIIEKSFVWLRQVEPRLKVIDHAVSAGGVYAIVKDWNSQFGDLIEINDHATIFHPHNPEQYTIIVVDHIRLLSSSSGPIKEQIDLCCNYLLGFRNKYSNTICVVQQLNRGFKSMDRRNSGTYQLLQLDDMADSSSPAQSSEIVIGIFDAYRERMNTCEGYQVVNMMDSFRLLQVMKNRFGASNTNVGVAFYGNIGYWKELPKASEIYDYTKYRYLIPLKDDNKLDENNSNKSAIGFKFG